MARPHAWEAILLKTLRVCIPGWRERAVAADAAAIDQGAVGAAIISCRTAEGILEFAVKRVDVPLFCTIEVAECNGIGTPQLDRGFSRVPAPSTSGRES